MSELDDVCFYILVSLSYVFTSLECISSCLEKPDV